MWCVNCDGPRADLDSVSGRPTPLCWAKATTGAGSRLWLVETTSQATGTYISALHTRESAKIAHGQALMSDGVFQGQVRNLET